MPKPDTESASVQYALTRYASQVGWTIASKQEIKVLREVSQTLLRQLMTVQIRVNKPDIDTQEVTT